MENLERIKTEILSNLKIRDGETLSKVDEEIILAMETEDHTDKNNLLSLYNIWQECKNEVGNENNGNSWIFYALGLTTKKPDGIVKPRRIMTRPSPPDIDSDIDNRYRSKVYEYATSKYGGQENVANTGTYQKLKFRASVRRAVKALDLAGAWNKGKDEYKTANEAKANEILGVLPKSKGDAIILRGPGGKTEKARTTQEVIRCFQDFAWYATEKYPELGKFTPQIEGLYSAFSSHPAALVISNSPLREIAPLRRGKKGNYATQFVYEELEKMGLIKIDFLALSTLAVIAECIRLIKQNYGIDIDIENIDWNDKKALELYNTGKLAGVFQCEEQGMQEKIKEIGIERFEDVMAAIALYRPGPIEYIPVYARRKRGEEPVKYPHPVIEKLIDPILKNTYGILVYQEQIILVCKALAGFSMTKGYSLIKDVSKKKLDGVKSKKEKFVRGCIKNGVPESIADQYWENTIVKFAEYGFNAAHACCYACLSLLTAYLKANYTEEYMCALLNVENERRKYDKIEHFEKDLRNFDMKLSPKTVNDCKVDYTIVSKKNVSNGVMFSELRPSLMVKNVGREAAEEIEKNQPFVDLRDLATRTSSVVDKGVIEGLYNAGFFADFAKKYNQKKKQKLTSEVFLKMFCDVREDLKKIRSKGVISENLFDQNY